jgi:glyoxylase-like metal-dependent hydrolase (beta-lactamase superfamily II)
LKFDLAEALALPEARWPATYRADLGRPIGIPVQNFLIEAGAYKILVDASSNLAPAEYWLPHQPRLPALAEQLAQYGIAVADITHVVITHPHFDHIDGLCDEMGQPVFQNARHWLAKADWDWAHIQTSLRDSNSLESKSLGVLNQCGLLDWVTSDFELCAGVQVLAAPGETPGHQVVRVQDGGQTLYCIGDIIHHPIEIEHDLHVTWADAVTNAQTRARIFGAAKRADALLIASHVAQPLKIPMQND